MRQQCWHALQHQSEASAPHYKLFGFDQRTVKDAVSYFGIDLALWLFFRDVMHNRELLPALVGIFGQENARYVVATIQERIVYGEPLKGTNNH